MDFAGTFKKLRTKANVSRYRLAQWSGLSEAYLMRLESGERENPSRDVVLMIGLSLAANSKDIDVFDINELLESALFAPLRHR